MGLKQNFGKRIKYLRKKAKLTQEKLAEIVEVDTKHISHIETGRSFPKADLIEKFALALNVGCEDFFVFEKIATREIIVNDIYKTIEKTDLTLLKIIHKVIMEITN